jgi:hypothetical protein
VRFEVEGSYITQLHFLLLYKQPVLHHYILREPFSIQAHVVNAIIPVLYEIGDEDRFIAATARPQPLHPLPRPRFYVHGRPYGSDGQVTFLRLFHA